MANDSSASLPLIRSVGYGNSTASMLLPQAQSTGFVPVVGVSVATRLLESVSNTGTQTPMPSLSSVTVPAIAATSLAVQNSPVALPSIIATSVATAGSGAVSDIVYLPMIVATGTTPYQASSSVTLPAIIQTSAAISGSLGTASATIPAITPTGYAYIPQTGGSSITLPSLIAQGIAGIGVGSNFVTVAMHTEWQALTTYTNYPFNSFAMFNNVFLGASANGLFSLSGDTDNGTKIDSVARMGVTDFGTSHLKKIEYAYVGYRTTGDCMLRVITNDLQTRDYRISATGETGLHVKRVKLGKGVVARYYQFEVQNIDGADFELNTLELKPTILSRRVFGGRA